MKEILHVLCTKDGQHMLMAVLGLPTARSFLAAAFVWMDVPANETTKPFAMLPLNLWDRKTRILFWAADTISFAHDAKRLFLFLLKSEKGPGILCKIIPFFVAMFSTKKERR